MIELLVMRHAKSDWTLGQSDFNRPLNDRGVRNADRMAEWLGEADLVPDRVVSSSAVRTRMTTMAIVYGCGVDRSVVDFEDDLYLGDAFTWLQVITRQDCRRLLICGHNPGLDDLVDYLTSHPVALTATGKLMTTAALAHFSFECDWSEIAEGSGQLLSLTRPREL